MALLIRPPAIKLVPKEGELEITLALNINITLDGKGIVTSQEVEVAKEEKKEEEPVRFIPDFASGLKLPTFGKK